ncbi:MAG: flagellar basal body rod C-terminal domain-containing protein [Pseudomonadota bacterium]
MTSIINIGRSGLLAAQTGIETTGQNIANAGTEGYLRREVVTREGISSDGVEVRDIRRAFDALLNARMLEAQSNQGAAEAFDVHARALKTLMLPDQNGVDAALGDLFTGLNALAQSPEDAGLRGAFVQAGEGLATQVRSLADAIDARASDIDAERALIAEQATTKLQELARIEVELSHTTSAVARNPLLDLREATLAELSEIVPVHISKDAQGDLTVRLGTDAGGTVLMAGGQAGRIEAAADGRVRAFAPDAPGAPTLWRPGSGIMGGLADAAAVVADTRSALDDWSARLAQQMNAVHAQGVTPSGGAGGPLFLTAGWQSTPGALQRGDTAAQVDILDEALMPAGPLTLVRDDAASQWQAVDPNGVVLGTGDTHINLPGLRINLSGTALDADRIELSRNDVDAGAFRFALTDGAEIAAGARFLITENPGNGGGLSVTASGTPPSAAREIRVLDASTGAMGLFDAVSGTQIATGALNSARQVRFEGYTLTVSGALSNGQTVTLEAGVGAPGDSRTLAALAGLQQADPDAGTGGFAAALARLRIDVGASVASGVVRLTTAEATLDAARGAIASAGGVNLDEEAARLIAQQQAYQANAQVISVGRNIFDTLLGSL